MDRIFVTAQYLKIAHYLFFSLAVFSVTSAFSLWNYFIEESIGFLIFSVIYLNATLWLAYFFYKDYKLELKNIMVITRYAKPYIILSLSVLVMTEAFILIIPGFEGLIFSIMFINFYYAFIIIIGAILYLFKPIRMLFDFQSIRSLRNGKTIAMKYSHFSEVVNYKIGSNPFVDEILGEICSNKTYPVPHVQRLEIELCQNKISEIEGRMELAKKWDWSVKLKNHLDREKKRYEKRIKNVLSYND